MKTKDFEAAVSRLAQRLEKYIEPIEGRIRKGQVRWFVCKVGEELYVFDHIGRCFRSYRDVNFVESDGDIHCDLDNFCVMAYHIICRPDTGLNLKFEEPCT